MQDLTMATTGHGVADRLVAALPDAVGDIDPAGRITLGNAALADLLGVPIGALVGIDMRGGTTSSRPRRARAAAAPVIAALAPLVGEALSGNSIDQVMSFTAGDATLVRRRVRLVPHRPRPTIDDRPTPGGATPGGATLVIADATMPTPDSQLHAAEDEVHRAVSHHLSDVVVVVRHGVITWVSESVRKRLGYEPAHLIGREFRGLTHPDDAIDLTLAPGVEVTQRARILLAEGSYRWFEHRMEVTLTADSMTETLYVTSRDVDEEIRLASLVGDSENRMKAALNASPDGFVTYHIERDTHGQPTAFTVTLINVAGAVGYAGGAAELIGKDVGELLPPEQIAPIRDKLYQVAVTGEEQRLRTEATTDQHTRFIDCVFVPLGEDAIVATWRDVTEAHQDQHQLAEAYDEAAAARATLHTALDAANEVFLVLDLVRDENESVEIKVAFANSVATEPLALTLDDVVGHELAEVFPDLCDERARELILQSVLEQRPHDERIHLANEYGIWTSSFDVTAAPVDDRRCVLISRDVTEVERASRELDQQRRRAEHQATHDSLTGLPNRALLYSFLTEALSQCPEHERVAVVFCDLDKFKQINDTYGHEAGDLVLKATAQRLVSIVRRHDAAARLAGDEFVLVLRHIGPTWDAGSFIERAAICLGDPVRIGTEILHPSASMGVVIANPRAVAADLDLHDILKRADVAMYERKAAPEPV